ncbi:MAG: nuclear transport factor 2 family protein [Planctomycetia bacterium]|nr:nuclear transport factor 2 family protein [Planctomycetia bacterium]
MPAHILDILPRSSRRNSAMTMPFPGPICRRASGRRGGSARAAGLLVAWAAAVLANACGHAAEPAGPPADVAAIRAAAAAYRAALAKGDAEAMRAIWTADGDIVDGWGNRLLARDTDALDGGPAATAGPRPEFRVNETQLRFITADVVVEDGTVDVVLPGMKAALEGWFSALWVRKGGDWKLAGLRESERPVVADADMVADLDWMVGDWVLAVDGDAGATIAGKAAPAAAAEMSVRWDAGRTFLVRDVRVPVAAAADEPAANDSTGGHVGNVVEVHQRIGWDPLVRRVRSWSFASDGSRGEATWFRDGDSWVAAQTAILPSGRQETSVNVYSYDGRDRFVWRVLPEAMDAAGDVPKRATWVRTSREGVR